VEEATMKVLKSILAVSELILAIVLTTAASLFIILASTMNLNFLWLLLFTPITGLIAAHSIYTWETSSLRTKTREILSESKRFWQRDLIFINLKYVFGIMFTIISPIMALVFLIGAVWGIYLGSVVLVFLYYCVLFLPIPAVPFGIFLLVKSFRQYHRLYTPTPLDGFI
jgi:hypothetical protein